MPHRFLIAPDPEFPGRFYAQHLATGECFDVPTDDREALRPILVHHARLLSEACAIVVDVEHFDADEDDQALFQELTAHWDETPVCLEPGCATPAPLYCSEHRHQLTAAEF